jgi:mRNA interferase RelE/StbE
VIDHGDAFGIEWTAAALRALDRLPDKVALAAVEFIYGSLASDPHRVGRQLRFELADLHSARRGDYRVVYRIEEARHSVVIDTIAHRSDVYRPRRRTRG